MINFNQNFSYILFKHYMFSNICFFYALIKLINKKNLRNKIVIIVLYKHNKVYTNYRYIHRNIYARNWEYILFK